MVMTGLQNKQAMPHQLRQFRAEKANQQWYEHEKTGKLRWRISYHIIAICNGAISQFALPLPVNRVVGLILKEATMRVFAIHERARFGV